jgi:hypothetical protein
MNYIKDFLQSTMFKRFLWTTLAGFLGMVVVYLGSIDFVYAPVIIAIIAGITKEINEKYGNIK